MFHVLYCMKLRHEYEWFFTLLIGHLNSNGRFCLCVSLLLWLTETVKIRIEAKRSKSGAKLEVFFQSNGGRTGGANSVFCEEHVQERTN